MRGRRDGVERCCAASTPSRRCRGDGVGVDGTPSTPRAELTHCTKRRFGHGTVKMVRQAQSREKLLQKKLEEGLTEKPQRDAEWDFSFPDPGQ